MYGPFPPRVGGGEEVERDYQGKGKTLHILVEATEKPIAISSTAAKGNERWEVEKLLDQLPVQLNLLPAIPVIEIDKGYDAHWLR